MVSPGPPPRRGIRVALGLPIVLAVVFGAISVAVVADAGGSVRSYASTSTNAAILDLTAGLGLVAAGAFHWWTHQRVSIGVLTALVGVAWLSADLIGWADGPAVARSVAMVVAPFLVPLVLHLSVAFPTGTVRHPAHRILVALAYTLTAIVSVGWALVRDPFLDRYCWSNCTDNSFLLRAEPDLARSLTDLWLRAASVIGVTIVAVCVVRLVRASHAGRRSLLAVLVPIVVVGVTLAAFAILLIADRAESPGRRALMSLFVARAGALVGLAAGLSLGRSARAAYAPVGRPTRRATRRGATAGRPARRSRPCAARRLARDRLLAARPAAIRRRRRSSRRATSGTGPNGDDDRARRPAARGRHPRPVTRRDP